MIALELKPEDRDAYAVVHAEKLAATRDVRRDESPAARRFLARVAMVHPRGRQLSVADAAAAAGTSTWTAGGYVAALKRSRLWPYR